jgi:hypothetical protein
MIRVSLLFGATLLGGWIFAWWWPAVPALLTGFWKPSRLARGFLAAVIGSGLAWGLVALWFDVRNEGLLAGRIAPLFHLPGGAGLIVASGLVGGFTAGLGSLFGARFRRFWSSLHEALVEVAAPVPEEEAGGRFGTGKRVKVRRSAPVDRRE